MEIQFQCTFGDYQEALAAQRVKSRPRKTLLAFAVLLVLLLGIFVLVSLRLTLAQSTVAMLAGSFIVAKLLSVASSFQFSRWLRRDFLNHPASRGKHPRESTMAACTLRARMAIAIRNGPRS